MYREMVKNVFKNSNSMYKSLSNYIEILLLRKGENL